MTVVYRIDIQEQKNLKSKTREDLTSRIQIQYKIEGIPISKALREKRFYLMLIQKKILQNIKVAKLLKYCQVLRSYNFCLQHYFWIKHWRFSRRIEVSFTWGSWHFDVVKSNPFCQLYLACSDTDVILLLLYFYPQISNTTIFHAITREVDVGCVYNALGNEKSKAHLGFHTFTGCDVTGRFTRFSKSTCFDTFLKSNSIVHKIFISFEIMTMVWKKI